MSHQKHSTLIITDENNNLEQSALQSNVVQKKLLVKINRLPIDNCPENMVFKITAIEILAYLLYVCTCTNKYLSQRVPYIYNKLLTKPYIRFLSFVIYFYTK